MKKWLWIPIAIFLHFSIPFFLEGYVQISTTPIMTKEIGLIGRIYIILPLLFILEYFILFKIVNVKSIAILTVFPIIVFFISFFIGLLYLSYIGGWMDYRFLFVILASNLTLFTISALFYRKATI